MKKEHVVIIVLLILLVVIGGAWIIISQFQPKGKEWDGLGQWNGPETEYNLTTPQFVVTGDEWRISSYSVAVHGGSHFEIIVYDAYTDNIVKEISLSPEQSVGSHETYLNSIGRFYMEIFIHGTLEKWQVSATEYR